MSAPLLIVLCATSAGFYVAAAAVLKVAGGAPFLFLLLPVVAALGLAAWFESLALPASRFGTVALLILAGEVLFTAGVALALGERYSLRELLGIGIVIAGIAIMHGAEGSRDGPSAGPAPGIQAPATAPSPIGPPDRPA